MMNKTDSDKLKIKLKKIYGYENFRPGQEDIIETILEKKKCSCCYADRSRKICMLPATGNNK